MCGGEYKRTRTKKGGGLLRVLILPFRARMSGLFNVNGLTDWDCTRERTRSGLRGRDEVGWWFRAQGGGR